MLSSRSAAVTAGVALGWLCLGGMPAPSAQGGTHAQTIAAGSAGAVRQWDSVTAAMLRSGELRVRSTRDDTLVAGHVVQRADQYYRGVRVFGADVTRQSDAAGVVQSLFGHIYSDISVGTDPGLDEDAARARIADLAGRLQPSATPAELLVLPDDDRGTFALAWRIRAVTSRLDIVQYFIDANTGDLLLQYSDRQSQAVVGRAVGVLGDSKKISLSGIPGAYVARDLLRPPLIETDDMKGDPFRTAVVLSGFSGLLESDLASRADLAWTDGAVDDAQVYAGYTYDYYFKRFGRRGLDDNNIRIVSLANPVHRTAADFDRYYSEFPQFFVNAFYAGGGMMVYGAGLPEGVTLNGQTWNLTSGALDIVGHELTHGVTEFTSNLIYRNESGALDEAFSDMMGTSIEFFFQTPGVGDRRADYLLGEDVIKPGGLRSMDNPGAYGDPDHYSKRFIGASDNGGVHTNSAIASQAFYLAIEGGANRTSGLTVQGVGAGSRDQIEKIFYRAFTQLLPSNATFAVARAATIQAARDLYGANSAAERAVTQAWTAVGVDQ